MPYMHPNLAQLSRIWVAQTLLTGEPSFPCEPQCTPIHIMLSPLVAHSQAYEIIPWQSQVLNFATTQISQDGIINATKNVKHVTLISELSDASNIQNREVDSQENKARAKVEVIQLGDIRERKTSAKIGKTRQKVKRSNPKQITLFDYIQPKITDYLAPKIESNSHRNERTVRRVGALNPPSSPTRSHTQSQSIDKIQMVSIQRET